MKTWTRFTRPLRHLLFTCSDTSHAGAQTGRSLMILKVASMPITWEISGDHPRSLSMRRKIANSWETITPSVAGRCVPKACFAISAIPRWRDSITQTSTKEFTVIAQGATNLRFVLSIILNKKVSMRKKWRKIIESQQKITNIKSKLKTLMLTSDFTTRHLRVRSQKLSRLRSQWKSRKTIFQSQKIRLPNKTHRICKIMEIALNFEFSLLQTN